MRSSLIALTLFGLLAAGAPDARAQTLSLAGKASGYLPVSDVYEVPGAVRDVVVTKDARLAVGAVLELSPPLSPIGARVGADYLTGLDVSMAEGLAGDPVVADGTMLMLSGDVVLRPIPRLLFAQPYALLGVGYKREQFRTDEGVESALPDDYSDYIYHVGIGIDASLGGMNLLVEVSDFFGRPDVDSGGAASAPDYRHDVFASIGLRYGIF